MKNVVHIFLENFLIYFYSENLQIINVLSAFMFRVYFYSVNIEIISELYAPRKTVGLKLVITILIICHIFVRYFDTRSKSLGKCFLGCKNAITNFSYFVFKDEESLTFSYKIKVKKIEKSSDQENKCK